MQRAIMGTKKRVQTKRKPCTAPSLPYESWLVRELKDPTRAAEYLNAVLEDGDEAAIKIAQRQIARAQV